MDASRARLFTLEDLEGPPGRHEPRFDEAVDLVNPSRRLVAGELFSDSRPGSDRTPSGRGYAVCDALSPFLPGPPGTPQSGGHDGKRSDVV
jgi:hypothetical protein